MQVADILRELAPKHDTANSGVKIHDTTEMMAELRETLETAGEMNKLKAKTRAQSFRASNVLAAPIAGSLETMTLLHIIHQHLKATGNDITADIFSEEAGLGPATSTIVEEMRAVDVDGQAPTILTGMVHASKHPPTPPPVRRALPPQPAPVPAPAPAPAPAPVQQIRRPAVEPAPYPAARPRGPAGDGEQETVINLFLP